MFSLAQTKIENMKEKQINITKDDCNPPNDRDLIIRGKLNTGWSSRSVQNQQKISEIELIAIQQVLNRAAQLECKELARITSLFAQYESINHASGNGESTCIVCGYQFSLLATKSYVCHDCTKKSCFDCTIEMMNAFDCFKLCRICNEYREFWKKSGAWFRSNRPQIENQQQKLKKENVEDKCVKIKLNNSSFNHINNELNFIPTAASIAQIQKSKSISLSFSSLLASSNTYTQTTSTSNKFKLNESSSTTNLSSTSTLFEESSLTTHQANTSKSASLTNISTNQSQLSRSSELLNNPSKEMSTQSQLDLPKQQEKMRLKQQVNNLGRLNFSVAYLSSVQQLKIHLKNAINLPARDANGLSDPYVKCHLLPGVAKSTKLRSKTIYKNLDPIFDEILVYEGISIADIDTKILRLTVLDEDKIGFDYIGEYRVSLKDLRIDEINSYEADLEEVREVIEEEDRKMRGKISVGLKYCTSTKTLHVKILKCAQLIPMDGGKSSDPFVEISISPVDSRTPSVKHRTSVKWKTLDPDYNEEFLFPNLDLKSLMNKTIDVSVWDKDIGSNDFIGHIKIGQRSKSNELKHFYAAIKNPDLYHEQWHDLKLSY